jgi:hypothetical protein
MQIKRNMLQNYRTTYFLECYRPKCFNISGIYGINTVSYVHTVPYLVSILFRLRDRLEHDIDWCTQRTLNVQTMLLVDYRHDNFCMHSQYCYPLKHHVSTRSCLQWIVLFFIAGFISYSKSSFNLLLSEFGT